MPSDLTRPATGDLRQHYEAVVMQQGRVILDRDFNALQNVVNGRIAAYAFDEIGPCGTPDDGLAISLPPPTQPASASASFPPPHPWDFLVKPGTMYVGGRRAVFEAPPQGQPPLSYFNQPDWPSPYDPFAHGSASVSFPRHEFVFLHAFEQEVGAVEDPDLLDVALGGPDTTQRVRLMRRVVRLAVTGADCAAALADAVADWGRHGYLFDPSTMRLLPQAALQVSFTSTVTTTNPCDPVTQGGYLGADNQLIRVMVSGGGDRGSASLLWGYDNASYLYRVTAQPDARTLQLAQPPVDAYHNPAAPQYVEVLRTAAVLGRITDQTGGPAVVRCAAAATGHVATVKSYNPADNTLVLDAPLPEKYTSDPNPLFLRVWVGRQTFDPSSATPVELIDPTGRSTPGLQVTVTRPAAAAAGATMPAGAFWLFAVRPATPQALYPSRFLDGPQPPDGPWQSVCPLAVIDWAGRDFARASASAPPADIHDCRCQFDNQVTLSKRGLGGCCTVTVRPSDAGRLQAILDGAVGRGSRVTVCLFPGTYALPAPLRLTGRHADLTLEACHGGATLGAAPDADPAPFGEGLVVLLGADRVTLRGLRIVAPLAPVATARARAVELVRAAVSPPATTGVMVGLRPINCLDLAVEGCAVEFPDDAPAPSRVLIAVGLFAAGDCTGLTVRDCRFTSAVAPTVIPQGQDTAAAVAPRAALLFGIVATPHLEAAGLLEEGRNVLPCVLDRASFRDNDFSSLTIPLLGWAYLGGVEVRDSRVRASVGGLWLLSLDSVTPGQALTSLVREIDLGLAALLLYPLPGEVDAASPRRAAARVQQGLTSVSVLNNHVEALPATRDRSGTVALLFVLSTSEGLSVTKALAVAGNVVYGRPLGNVVGRFGRPAVVELAVGGPTAVTGNVFIHGHQGDGSYCLEIAYRGQAESGSTALLAVSGNVLRGNTNLADLHREDGPGGNDPLAGWLGNWRVFNSVSFGGGELG